MAFYPHCVLVPQPLIPAFCWFLFCQKYGFMRVVSASAFLKIFKNFSIFLSFSTKLQPKYYFFSFRLQLLHPLVISTLSMFFILRNWVFYLNLLSNSYMNMVITLSKLLNFDKVLFLPFLFVIKFLKIIPSGYENLITIFYNNFLLKSKVIIITNLLFKLI